MINIDQNEAGDFENMHDFELEKRDDNDLSAWYDRGQSRFAIKFYATHINACETKMVFICHWVQQQPPTYVSPQID